MAATADHEPLHLEKSPPCGGEECPAQEDPVVAAPPLPQASPMAKKPDLLDRIGSALGGAAAAVGDAAGAVGRAVAGAAAAVCNLLASMGAAIASGAAAAVAGFVALVQALVKPLAQLLIHHKPAAMSGTAYAGAAAAGTAAITGGAQAGAWWSWRKLAPLLALVPGFSRIAKDELLDHDRRAKIFEMIKQNPGIRLSELAHGLDLPWGSCMHHLRKLRADRLITFKQVGHHKCYFVNGSGLSDHEMAAVSLVKGDTLQGIAAYLDANPRVSLKELAQGVGISSPLAAFHVGKLARAGLVQKVRDGRSVRLVLAAPLPHALLTPVDLRTTASPAAPAPVAT
jgi:Mn-dependent DtxR family transcriptional regulator